MEARKRGQHDDLTDKTLFRKAFGMALREIRRRRRYSQEDVAIEVGTTRGHLSAMESGLGDPKLGMLIRLANALDIDLVALMRETQKNYNILKGDDPEPPMSRIVRDCLATYDILKRRPR